MRVFRFSAAIAVALLLVLPSFGRAQALTGFSGGTLFTSFQSDGDTVGWRFSVNRPVIVTHLGFWDGDATAATPLPMVNSHAVGLWDAVGNLLTSNVVNPTSPFTGQFRYEPTANVVLPAGTYNLGAFYPAGNLGPDGYLSSTTGITMSPGFTMLNTMRDADGPQTGLVFPTIATAPAGRFGPNMLFSEVPEPASAMTVTLIACGALLRRRR